MFWAVTFVFWWQLLHFRRQLFHFSRQLLYFGRQLLYFEQQLLKTLTSLTCSKFSTDALTRAQTQKDLSNTLLMSDDCSKFTGHKSLYL